MPKLTLGTETHGNRKSVVNQDDLYHWIDVFLDIVEENTEQHVYALCVQIMQYLVQVELDHFGDRAGGN